MIEKAIEHWKADEQDSIAASLRGSPIYDPKKGRAVHTNRTQLSKVRNIENTSEFELRNFWFGHRLQGFSLDATMLRAVECCQIGGFERWWRRLARILDEDTIRGGIEENWAISYLFNMARANLALKIMPSALTRMLDAVGLSRYGEAPWLSIAPFPTSSGRPDYRPVEDIGYAGALVFATLRIRGDQGRNELLDEAISLIQRTQHTSGSWPMWLQKDSSSIEDTAITLHALSVSQPLGWERCVSKGANWLLTRQDPGGFWAERSCPDPAYLTVLVLDAIGLAQGTGTVTFRSPLLDGTTPSNRSARSRRFKVAVSFPGTARKRVEEIVRSLQSQLGGAAVFYDRDFASELALPNLDLRLQTIYHDEADLVVVFIAQGYDKRDWCGLEWRGIRDLIKTRREQDVMFLRLDDANLPAGMLSIDGYLDVSARSAEEIVPMILKRLGST